MIVAPQPITNKKNMEQNNSKAPDGWRGRFYDNFIKNDSMDGLMFRSSIQPYHIVKFIESLIASKDQEIERLKSELATLQSSIPGLLKEQGKEG